METTEFSGAPQGDDSRRDGADAGADFGFFDPTETPDEVVEAPQEQPPAHGLLDSGVVNTGGSESSVPEPFAGIAAEPTGDAIEPSDVAAFDPGSFDAGSLLAPEAPITDSTAGLPMSLAIAAEEAASVDVDAEQEPPQSFDYQAFHEQTGGPDSNGEADVTVDPGAGTDQSPAQLAEAEPAAAPAPYVAPQEYVPPEQMVELADAEAEDGAYSRITTEPALGGEEIVLVDLLLHMLEKGASDLHITAGARPAIRVNGELFQMEEYPVLTPPVIQRVMYAAITQRQRETFEEVLELDFAYSVPGRARFRVNMYRQRDSVGAAFRIIPFEIKRLEDLGVPQAVANFAALPRGFVLVTGPTGSGKSTTLASLLDLANRNRKEHIMTCEDPIEFLHRHQACLVNQREVGEDTKSFQNALKHVLRQDPDIILVGEMRDLETIEIALTAAETGHLVFATLHTQDAAQTIDRIIDVFPTNQQQQVRVQLAGSI
ncbi:MAG: type IV pilus twitching motility protein PilT, partial [Actinomycetes bacterium]